MNQPASALATFGQKSIHRAIAQWPAQRLPAANVRRVWPLPPSSTVDSVNAALAAVEQRHDALRTGFRLDDDGDVRQVVLAADPQPTGVVDLDDTGYADVAAVTVALSRDAFDLERERPWRRLIVTSAGAPLGVAVALHHIAADGWAANILRHDFLALLVGEPLAAVEQTCQEIAHHQWSPAWAPRRIAAAEHWRAILASAPPPVQPPDSTAAVRVTTIRSPRLVSAATRVAARANATLHSVLLAAFCAVTAREAGTDELVVGLMSGNRSEPAWRHVVSSFTQLAPVMVRLKPGEDLIPFSRRLHRDALNAYRHGCYDVDMRAALAAEHGRAGATLGLRYFYNYSPVADTAKPPADQEVIPDDADRVTVSEGPGAGFPTYVIAGNGHPSILTLNESAPGCPESQSISRIESLVELVVAAS